MEHSIDREKVIKCLEACTGGSNDCAGHTCPYWDFDDSDVSCRTQMELDALAMLKEQEAVVRCLDCKWGDWSRNGKGEEMILCYNGDTGIEDGYLHEPDWFCAEGKRKESR